MERENKIEKNLMIPERESIFIRLFKWAKKTFGKKEEKIWTEEPVTAEVSDITVPKAVKMPITVEEPEEFGENSLEYLYKLSDEKLDELDKLYDGQIEEAKNEVLKLENILQNYKQNIKRLQENLGESEV